MRAIVAPLLRRGIVKNLVARDVWRAGADACWARFERVLDQLDARTPERGFWVGDELSAADFGLFGQLQAFRTPLTPKQSASVARRTALSAYLDRVDAATRATSERRELSGARRVSEVLRQERAVAA